MATQKEFIVDKEHPEYKPNEQENKKRAIGYALCIVSFQEVGAGPDENLGEVREIVARIRTLCKSETGILLEGYPVDFLKENKELTRKEYPFLKNILGGEK